MGSFDADNAAGSFMGISERESARDEEIMSLLPLVKELATHIYNKVTKNNDYNDLVSAGIYGLLDAFRRYDSNQETPFRVFAFMRIRGAILDSLRDEDPGTRTLRQKARQVEEAIGKLTLIFGRRPTELEVAEYLDMPLKQYQTLLAELWQLNISSYDSEDSELSPATSSLASDTKAYTETTPHDLLEKKESCELLFRAIDSLPERERNVIVLYYYNEMTLKEIGKQLGVVESYVSKIHAKALLLLGAAMRQGKVATEKKATEKPFQRNRTAVRKGPVSIQGSDMRTLEGAAFPMRASG